MPQFWELHVRVGERGRLRAHGAERVDDARLLAGHVDNLRHAAGRGRRAGRRLIGGGGSSGGGVLGDQLLDRFEDDLLLGARTPRGAGLVGGGVGRGVGGRVVRVVAGLAALALAGGALEKGRGKTTRRCVHALVALLCLRRSLVKVAESDAGARRPLLDLHRLDDTLAFPAETLTDLEAHLEQHLHTESLG